MNAFRCMTDRTYAIFATAMKKHGLPVEKAYEWFNRQTSETIRNAGKTGIVKFILENQNEWNR